MKKIWIFFLVLGFVIVGVVLFGLIKTDTSNEISQPTEQKEKEERIIPSGHTLYKKQGVSIIHPRIWIGDESVGGGNFVVFEPLDNTMDCSLYVSKQQTLSSLEEYSEKETEALKQICSQIMGDECEIITKDLTLSELPGKSLSTTIDDEVTVEYISVKEEIVYTLTYIGASSTHTVCLNDIEKMVNSFQITK